MATRVSGVVVRWGGSTASTAATGDAILEVYEATIDERRDPPAGRTAAWSPEMGSVTLAAFTRDALPATEYGKRRLLTITAQADTGAANSSSAGPDEVPDTVVEEVGSPHVTTTTPATFTLFSADCVYRGAEVAGRVNDVWRFDHQFRIADTRGGNTRYPS
jgi:hypothetical protein